jgi:hypothetical protein
MNSIIVAEPNPAEPSTGSLLLDRLWQAARKRGDSQPTADRLVDWARRFILFHNKAASVAARAARGGPFSGTRRQNGAGAMSSPHWGCRSWWRTRRRSTGYSAARSRLPPRVTESPEGGYHVHRIRRYDDRALMCESMQLGANKRFHTTDQLRFARLAARELLNRPEKYATMSQVGHACMASAVFSQRRETRRNVCISPPRPGFPLGNRDNAGLLASVGTIPWPFEALRQQPPD